MVREYDVDAFRLDTAIYMPKYFLKDLQEAAGVEILGETTVNNISRPSHEARRRLIGLPEVIMPVFKRSWRVS